MSFLLLSPKNWLDVVCCSGFPVLNDVHCNAALCNEDCSWLIFLRASTWAESKKILWIWQNPKYPTQYTKMEVTSWYQITLYAFQFMICPSLWNEVQLPNIKIFLKRKWYCPKFGQIFFFSGKHLSPRLQKQHICFAARLGFIAFQGRQSQTNTFSSQKYIFILLSACFLFF